MRKEGGDYLMWANGKELQETISDHSVTQAFSAKSALQRSRADKFG